MQGLLGEKARHFIAAINFLEGNSKAPSSKLREQHLQVILEVAEIGLPLNSVVIEKVFLNLVILISNESLVENEREILIKIFTLIFKNYSSLLLFLWKSQDSSSIAALLLYRCLESTKHQSKAISYGSVNVVKELILQTPLGTFHQFFPGLCTTFFRCLNAEIKLSRKSICAIIQTLDGIFQKFFSFGDEPLKEFCGTKGSESSFEIMKDFLKAPPKATPQIKSEKRPDEKKEPKSFHTEVRNKIDEFFNTLVKNFEVVELKTSVAEQYLRFLITCLSKSFYLLSDRCVFSLLKLYMIVSGILEDNKNDFSEEETSKQIVSILESKQTNFKLEEQIRAELIKGITLMGRLKTQVESARFIKTFRYIRNCFLFLKAIGKGRIQYSLNEIELNETIKVINKAFVFTPNNRILTVNENYLGFISPLLNNTKITDEIVEKYEEMIAAMRRQIVTENLTVTNFEEKIYNTINKMFQSWDKGFSYRIYSSCTEELLEIIEKSTQGGIEGIFTANSQRMASLVFILMQTMGNLLGISFFSRNFIKQASLDLVIDKQRAQEISGVILSLLNLDFMQSHAPVEESDKIKSLYDSMKIEIIIKGFVVLSLKGLWSEPSTRVRIIEFLLEKYDCDNFHIKTLCEMGFIYMTLLSGESYLYSLLKSAFSSVSQRLFTQIKSLHLLNNKLVPFCVMNSMMRLLQVEKEIAPEVSLFESFFDEVFTNLISSYDRYYLRSDNSFTKLFLRIFKSLIEVIEKRTDSWTKEREKESNQEDSGPEIDGNKYEKTNLLRQLLLRIKPLVISSHLDVQIPALEIFTLSAPLLHEKKMNVEEGKVNFSTDDPVNVSIPDALAPLAHEFFDSFVYGLKRNTNAVPQSAILDAIIAISELNIEFLFHNSRLEKHLWPLFESIIANRKREQRNLIKIRLMKKIVHLLMTIRFFSEEELFKYSVDFRQTVRLTLCELELNLNTLIKEPLETLGENYRKEIKKVIFLLELILKRREL